MALEDFANTEVGIAVAATALIVSPPVRNILRRGLVYGLAGVLRVGDTVAGTARDVAGGAQGGTASASNGMKEMVNEAKTVAKGRKPA